MAPKARCISRLAISLAARNERGIGLRTVPFPQIGAPDLQGVGGEQAALLHAIETGCYYPLGSDHEVTSRFQVIAGTSRDPVLLTAEGRFRPDLLARLNMWSVRLPALRDRPEDIEANLIVELARSGRELGIQVGCNTDARALYLRFARDPATLWPGNFRDFGSSIRRLCTLAPRGRITRTKRWLGLSAQVRGVF